MNITLDITIVDRLSVLIDAFENFFQEKKGMDAPFYCLNEVIL